MPSELPGDTCKSTHLYWTLNAPLSAPLHWLLTLSGSLAILKTGGFESNLTLDLREGSPTFNRSVFQTECRVPLNDFEDVLLVLHFLSLCQAAHHGQNPIICY